MLALVKPFLGKAKLKGVFIISITASKIVIFYSMNKGCCDSQIPMCKQGEDQGYTICYIELDEPRP